ncbi:CoA transferase [Amycolatopsis sp. NPDC047767]|uniref:CaiB/BaiF CoA transferase family protein n=1 Tax=Amycolatopsis sp. NPDC047767 TaxID=3156765 RepID=UPI0034559835
MEEWSPRADKEIGPLSGALVVDLSRALAGPHATMMMADLGARVIKVEPPGTGDDTRTWGPPFVGSGEARVATYFLAANRNKESLQLDLKRQEDFQTLCALIRRADVLVENYRPGVLDRLGLTASTLETLNPGLVVLSISGFGHDGPEGGRAGYDQIAQGESGLMSLTGPSSDQPTRIGVPIGDILAGLNGAVGVLAALVARARTGRGMVVRTSLLAGLVGAHAFQGTRWTVAHEVPRSSGNQHPQIAPYGAFRCADGQLQIAVGSQPQWRRFAGLVGLDPDDPRFADNAGRAQNRAELTSVIERVFRRKTRTQWLADLAEAGIPAGAIRTLDEVYEWDQTRSQGLVITVDHVTAGKIELPGPALRLESFDGTPAGRANHEPPPLLGADAVRIREWLAGQTSSREEVG